jgi:hypothetical protein
MTDLKSVRKFEYRPCRITTGFDVDFVVGGLTLSGICRDVSDTGIRVKLEGSVAVGDSGLLILHHPTGMLRLEAHVAYIDKCHVGLVFAFETPWERTIAIEYMATIANRNVDSMVVRFP